MAAFLQNLSVNKVSFVRRGANKKPFFLAKSEDPQPAACPTCGGEMGDEDVCKACSTNNKVKKEKEDHLSGGITIVRKEVKDAIKTILKAGHNNTEVVNLLKAEVDLKVTDAEIAEITDFLDLVPAVEVTKKSDNEVVITKEQFDSMQSNLQKLQDSQHRSEVRKWVEDECPNLNMSIGDAVDAIVKAETAGETVAKSLKDSFKSTSDALKNNTIFKEFGRSGDASGTVPDDTLGNGIVSEIKKNVAEISKSDSKSSSHEVVLDSIRKAAGSDGVRFMQYRDQHVRRAKLA